MTTEITDDYVQTQLNEGLRCIGCGALMQITSPEKAGYLPLSALKKAFSKGYNTLFTDDASVFEQAGHSITLTDGNTENIKITTPEDLEWAAVYLK